MTNKSLINHEMFTKDKWLIYLPLTMLFIFTIYLLQQKENNKKCDDFDKIENFKETKEFIKCLYSKNSGGSIIVNKEFSKKYLTKNEIEDMNKSVDDINKKILSGEVELDDDFQLKNSQSVEIIPVSSGKPIIIPLPKNENQ